MKKILFIDYLRVSAMLMIILYHCLCYYTNRWTDDSPRIDAYEVIAGLLHGIALPLFACISGYLYCKIRETGRYSDYRKYIWGKVKRILLPLIIWSIVCISIIPGASMLDLQSGGYKHLWFLGMMFWLFLIAPLLTKVYNNSNRRGLLLLVATCIVSFLFSKSIFAHLPLFISEAGCYLFAFFAGIYSAKMNIKVVHNNSMLTSIFVLCYLLSMSLIPNGLVGGGNGLVRILLEQCICIMMISNFSTYNIKRSPFILKLSACSMGIYII